MKAIVINDSPGEDIESPPFKIGEEVTLEKPEGLAYDARRFLAFPACEKYTIVKEYEFCECGCGNPVIYLSSRFAPLSEEDNIQLTEEQAEAIRKRRDLNLVNSWIDKLEKAWKLNNED